MEMTMITTEQWQSAQAAERKAHDAHTETPEQLFEHYRDSYRQYFQHVGLTFDLPDKKILEIGPADYPALAYCTGFHKSSLIIEPLPSQQLLKIAVNYKLGVVQKKAEEFSIFEETFDECWMFNLLQHVQSPDAVIRMAKKYCNTIRFFEPINTPVDQCHLHSFTLNEFRNWFSQCGADGRSLRNVMWYPANPGAVNFHTAECAYGIWRAEQ